MPCMKARKTSRQLDSIKKDTFGVAHYLIFLKCTKRRLSAFMKIRDILRFGSKCTHIIYNQSFLFYHERSKQ